MAKRFHVTYEVITEESAADGDAADRGYIMGANMHVEVSSEADRRAAAMDLRSACNLVGCLEDSGSWFSEVDGTPDYRTGDHEFRSIHPPKTITAASYARLRRVLCDNGRR